MKKIGILGLGYVGLPLAVAFEKKMRVVGYDTDQSRICELTDHYDRTGEIDTSALKNTTRLTYSCDPEILCGVDYFIVTVPTPIDDHKKPDLSLLRHATRTVGKILTVGNIVIFESTVYPGCTRDVCVPILEQESGLSFNKDFYCGYSPERINPGDKKHTLSSVKKIISGSTPWVTEVIDNLYRKVVHAGTHKVSSIEVAEAAKVIENTQRDLNIALVNELAMLFEKIKIDTHEVLAAAATKWNFMYFRPGLVGGHCIGVDPFYLTYKAENIGYNPNIILSGRKINDTMPAYIADTVVELLSGRNIPVKESKILILGITFKENCSDVRNSKAADIVMILKKYGAYVETYDPYADPKRTYREYGLTLTNSLQREYDAIVLAVAHKSFKNLDCWNWVRENNIIVYDVQGFLDSSLVTKRL